MAEPAEKPDPEKASLLFRLLVERPVLTMMVTIAILLVGAMSLWRLPLAFLAEGMVSGTVNVWVPIGQSRSPRETEDKIVRPAEELLRTIPGIKSVRSESHSMGARFGLELEESLDPVLASAEIRDRFQRAMLQWPEGVDRYFTWREDGSSAPLAFFQILAPEFSPEWQNRIEHIVKPRLEAVDGVGRVDIFGNLEESIRIWFDRDKLLAHRVDYRKLLTRLAEDNYTEPAGELANEDSRLLLRVDSSFGTYADIENFPVRPGLLLKDIARVERARTVENRFSRFEGKFTFTGAIRATAGVNPVEASERLQATTEELRQDSRLKGLDFRFLFDQGKFIKNSLNTLVTASLQGGALALLVLLLFLRNLRSTLTIGFAIPLTLLVVCGYLFFSGGSLNILTMTGMTLAVGMVVDNSVVVLENIRRLRHEGLSLHNACVRGASEVGLAVVMATLTTIVVFLPMIFMSTSPQMRAMSSAVGMPLSVALLGSLFVALLLLPSMVRWIGGVSQAHELHLPTWSPIRWLLGFNQALLRWSLSYRYWILLAAVGYLGLLAGKALRPPLPTLEMETGDKSPFRASDISLNMEMPKGMESEDVYQEVRGFEDFLEAHREEWKIKSVSARFDRSSIRMDIQLLDEIKSDQVTDYSWKIRKAWPRRPGIKPVLRNVGNDQGSSEEEKDLQNFVVRLRGRDSEHLAELGLKLKDRLLKLEEVEKAEVSLVSDNEEVVLSVDRDRLQDLGVLPEVLFGTVRGGLQGRELPRFQEGGHDIRMITQFDSEQDPTLSDLKETQVFSNRGNFQRLSDLAQVQFKKSLGSISRLDGRTTVSVVGSRAVGIGPRAFTGVLEGVMKTFPLPRGYSWTEDSVSRETAAQLEELFHAGILSLVLVFLLMGILFESVVLPLSIMITVVIANFGAFWSLKFFHGAIDPMAVTGMILLSGVVVNNGIVLLDCIEKLRAKGLERRQAIFEGVRIRLRPIAMTASTTIVGLMPMALFGEPTGQGINYVSLSVAVSGGLALCTLLTAPAVSICYSYFDDLSQWICGLWPGARRSAEILEAKTHGNA